MIEIFISPSENLGFVWNVDEWLKLRQDYRIVGNLIGSLSKYPRQNSFNGLPLCLQPEEVSLLKEKKFVKLISCSSLTSRPDDTLVDIYIKEEKIFQESQRKLYIQKKKADVERSFDSIVEGKTMKNANFDSSNDMKILVSEEVNKIQSISSKNVLCCTPIGDPWLQDEQKLESNWSYPSNEIEKLKYEVFKDLWEKNYYITRGAKFGGDFLCYSGDPVKFHAEFIVLCLPCEKKLSVKDVVTFGRIGSSTKKTFTLATRIEEKIIYQSLQWTDGN